MRHFTIRATSVLFSPPLTFLFFLFLITSCQKNGTDTSPRMDEEVNVQKKAKSLKDFMQVNLVGSNDEYDPVRIDPLMVNGWGIAFSPTGTIWISAEATGVSTVYNKDGNQQLPAVSIPSPGGATGGHPTGQVFNGGTGFRLPNGNPARFIFAGADGVVSGWNGGTAAIRKIDNSPASVYLGMAIARDGTKDFIYLANFSQGRIDVYDTAWQAVSKPFIDPTIPGGYAPFNIQNIDGKLYVMYAKVGVGAEEPGPGNGYVSIFNPDGSFIKRFASRGQLNAPWGVAKAPASFWGDSPMTDVILIGNFGDGRINAFDDNGNFLGQLRAHGEPIVIDGLWAISFAPTTATAINPNWLYFAAGPDDEEEGLFGYITKEGE
jgi:uncharacterized protein (TIGR03118 family)